MHSKSNLFVFTSKSLGLLILILGFSSCSPDKSEIVQDRLELEIFSESENLEQSIKKSLDSKNEFSPLDQIYFKDKNKGPSQAQLKLRTSASCVDPLKQKIERQSEIISQDSFLLYEVLPKEIQLDHLAQEYLCELNMEFTNSIGSKFITRSGLVKVRGNLSAFKAELRRHESPLTSNLPRLAEEDLAKYAFESYQGDTKKIILSCEAFESQILSASRPRIQLTDIPRSQPQWINPTFSDKRVTQKCRILAKDNHQTQGLSQIFWLQRSYAGLEFKILVRPPEKLIRPDRNQIALMTVEFLNLSPTPAFVRMPRDHWLKPFAAYEAPDNLSSKFMELPHRFETTSGSSGRFILKSDIIFIELPPNSSHRLTLFQGFSTECFTSLNARCEKIEFQWNKDLNLELMDPSTDPNLVLQKMVLESSLKIKGIL